MITNTAAPHKPVRSIAVVAAIPPLLLACVVTMMLAAGAAGRHPMWRTETLNMSEAAAARDIGTIASLLDRGEDPNARRQVGPPLLDGIVVEVTPLEAGVAAGRLEVVHLLWSRGGAVDEPRRVALACEALHRGYNDVAEFLTGSVAGSVCNP